MNKLEYVKSKNLRTDFAKFKPGDRINVHFKVIEGDKERIQQFEGDVISIRGEKINTTIVVRKISDGVGVERIFPLHSPKIAKIELVREGKIRRAKLYYLRKLAGKAAKIKNKNA